MATPNIFRRVLVYALLTIGLLTFASAIISYEYLRSYAPRQPNSETGQIYPMALKQPFDVYLTQHQIEWLNGGPFIGIALAAVGSLLNTRWKIIHNPSDNLPKKLY